MTIGEQVRTRRKNLGLTQKQIAAKVGIHPSFLSLIEADKRDPSLAVLNRVANAVGARVFILWKSK